MVYTPKTVRGGLVCGTESDWCIPQCTFSTMRNS